MKTKSFAAQVKSVGTEGDEDSGEFEALVSVFNNVDLYGEVVMPGAFAKTLKAWETRGDPIPVIWSHQWADPFSHVGVVRSATETDKGLLIKGFISPEERAENPTANQVYKLLKSRRVTQFSFGFDVEEAGPAERKSIDGTKSRDVYELRELKLHEVGPCLLGVNPDTELHTVKSSGKSALEELLDLSREILANQHLAATTATQTTTVTDGGGNSTDETHVANEEDGSGVAPESSASGSTDQAGTPSTLLIDLALAELDAESF